MPSTTPTQLGSEHEVLERAAVVESAGSVPRTARRVGLALGALVLVGMLLAPVPGGLRPEAWRTAAVGLLMAAWWMTEALPIPVTAMLPLLLFPWLGAGTMEESAAPYANPLVFLFLGGFVLALAIQRCGLHRRIALNIVRVMGVEPRSIVAGFLTATALLSMWVSNTATTMMMLPIGLSVVQLAGTGRAEEERAAGFSNFGTCLMLAIAYGSSIGGMATLIGTPTNALLAGFFHETYGVTIGFLQWMLVGLPLMLVGLPLTHLVLTRVVHPVRLRELPGGRELIRDELARLGPLSTAERRVAAVAGLTALLWVTQPLTAGLLPGISDTTIAMFGAISLFLVPSGAGEPLMEWETAESLPWGVLLLFGGGLSLAAAVSRTGLAEWIGAAFRGIAGWPVLALVLLATTVVILLTELTSNVATAAAFLPVMTALAVGVGQSPLLLAVPTVLAASAAFMLPVATPPNAIVYGSRFVTIPQMARAGLALNVVFVVLITGLTYTLVFWVFGVEPGVVPAWAAGR